MTVTKQVTTSGVPEVFSSRAKEGRETLETRLNRYEYLNRINTNIIPGYFSIIEFGFRII